MNQNIELSVANIEDKTYKSEIRKFFNKEKEKRNNAWQKVIVKY